MFSSLSQVIPIGPSERQVVVGHLEQSSVEPTTKMMEMIETSRAFEANVRMIQNQDHAVESLINRLLRTS